MSVNLNNLMVGGDVISYVDDCHQIENTPVRIIINSIKDIFNRQCNTVRGCGSQSLFVQLMTCTTRLETKLQSFKISKDKTNSRVTKVIEFLDKYTRETTSSLLREVTAFKRRLENFNENYYGCDVPFVVLRQRAITVNREAE